MNKLYYGNIVYPVGTTYSNGYSLGYIDNEPLGIIANAMQKSNIEGIFGKGINKKSFYLKSGHIINHSMNSGHGWVIADVTNDNDLVQIQCQLASKLKVAPENIDLNRTES